MPRRSSQLVLDKTASLSAAANSIPASPVGATVDARFPRCSADAAAVDSSTVCCCLHICTGLRDGAAVFHMCCYVLQRCQAPTSLQQLQLSRKQAKALTQHPSDSVLVPFLLCVLQCATCPEVTSCVMCKSGTNTGVNPQSGRCTKVRCRVTAANSSH